MAAARHRFEQFFLLFLFTNPLLDLIYGVQIYILNGAPGMVGSFQLEVTPRVSISLLVRMAVLLAMAAYLVLIRDKRAILAGAGILASFAFTAILAHSRGNYNIAEDIAGVARFSFNIAAIFTYSHIRRGPAGAVISWTLLVFSLGILIPCALGIGFYTYADAFGLRGCRGFFYSGNDAACVMMLLLPLLFGEILSGSNSSPLNVVSAALCMAAMLVLGTKTSCLALAITAAIGFVYGIKHDSRKTLAIAASFAAVYLAMSLLTGGVTADTVHDISAMTAQNYSENGAQAAILSGREAKLAATWSVFRTALPLSALFGIGRGSMDFAIEMDIFELLLYYGAVGAAAFIWPYIRFGIKMLCQLVRRLDFSFLCCLLSLAMGCGYLFLAGHTLFSVTSGFYFAMTLLYAKDLSTHS